MALAKRICFSPRFSPNDTGGVAVHIRQLATHLAARGWQVLDQPDEEALLHGHAITRAQPLDLYTSHGIYPIKERMSKWQIDANRVLFDNLKLAGEVIAVSAWSARQWSGFVGRTPHIIYNAIDPQDWHIAPGLWRAKLALRPGEPLVLWGKTGITDVLDPTPLIELALRYPSWRFVTPLPPAMLRTAPKNLTCLGPQPYPLMQQLIQDCDVYLATVCENHSIQVLEAMACQKAILGYAWGGTAETVVTGESGTLVEGGNLAALVAALPEVYANREQLGKGAYARVLDRFTIDRQIDQLEGVYDMVLQARSRVRAAPHAPIKYSIIIPVYNKANYVAETMQSALRQVLATPRYEVIVVNDGSTDNSEQAIRSTAAAFTNLVAVHRKLKIYNLPNSGVAAARNFGITKAEGEYICCLDADDLLDSHFLVRLGAALDADPGLGIAYSDFTVFGLNAAGLPWEAPLPGTEYDFERLQRGNFLPCCNLFRKTAWQRAGGYKNINPSWEDYELWLNMGKLGWYGRRVPGILFKYRKVANTGRDHASHGLEWRLRGTVNKYHRDLYPPLISVVIPCYRQAEFLATAIDSVRAQTLPDHEIVVVDDGNAAEEAARIRAIVAGYGDGDVRLLRLNNNGGLANARNAGIGAARGNWIVPLDADDKLDPRFLELALQAVNLEPAKFAYSDCYLWWPDAENKLKRLDAHDYDFDELLTRITWSCAILFAKSAWQEAGGYKPQMSEAGGWEDWEYAIQLGRNGVCGVRVPEPLFYYRQHSGTQMRHQAEERKPQLQEALRRTHADLYRGERPMPCCGAGNRRAPTAPAERTMPASGSLRAVPATATGVDAMVLIRYVGAKSGAQTWRTPAGYSYRFDQDKPLPVRQEDAAFFTARADFQQVGQ